MDEPMPVEPHGGHLDWLMPRRGRWRWALVRMGVAAALIVAFRYQVITRLVVGHNLVWQAVTGSAGNHPGDVQILSRLGRPGANALIEIGEAGALTRVSDPAMIPALLDIARSHEDAQVRVFALWGLSAFRDERSIELATALLADPDSRIRLAAAQVFGDLAEARHVPVLREAARKETVGVVRRTLERAIAAVGVPGRPGPDSPTVKVAAIQCVSEFGKPEANRKRLERLVREAAAKGARIIVLPETAIPGYLSFDIRTTWQADGMTVTEGLRGAPVASVAEAVPGPSTERFGALAGELGVYLTVPIIERDTKTGKFYNTLCLMGPDGRLVLHYRKRNPWPFAERGWAARGDRGLQVADTPYGRLALLICYDIHDELGELAQKRVDTLLYSIAWVDSEKSPWFDIELPRLAREHNLNIVGANWTVPARPDWHGYGHSRIIGRDGRILAKASGDTGTSIPCLLSEEIVIADLPVPDGARKRD